MKVFIATRSGLEPDDYSDAIAGELVRLPVTCDQVECDCGNAMTGLGSGLGTTTFTVREFNLNREIYHAMLWDTLLRDSWIEDGNREDVKWVSKLVDLHIRLADGFEPGIPLRLNGDRLYERR
ncbi:hypothetical protein BH23ACT5_BH23ACT5_23940 [soil metagenome]